MPSAVYTIQETHQTTAPTYTPSDSPAIPYSPAHHEVDAPAAPCPASAGSSSQSHPARARSKETRKSSRSRWPDNHEMSKASRFAKASVEIPSRVRRQTLAESPLAIFQSHSLH